MLKHLPNPGRGVILNQSSTIKLIIIVRLMPTTVGSDEYKTPVGCYLAPAGFELEAWSRGTGVIMSHGQSKAWVLANEPVSLVISLVVPSLPANLSGAWKEGWAAGSNRDNIGGEGGWVKMESGSSGMAVRTTSEATASTYAGPESCDAKSISRQRLHACSVKWGFVIAGKVEVFQRTKRRSTRLESESDEDLQQNLRGVVLGLAEIVLSNATRRRFGDRFWAERRKSRPESVAAVIWRWLIESTANSRQSCEGSEVLQTLRDGHGVEDTQRRLREFSSKEEIFCIFSFQSNNLLAKQSRLLQKIETMKTASFNESLLKATYLNWFRGLNAREAREMHSEYEQFKEKREVIVNNWQVLIRVAKHLTQEDADLQTAVQMYFDEFYVRYPSLVQPLPEPDDDEEGDGNEDGELCEDTGHYHDRIVEDKKCCPSVQRISNAIQLGDTAVDYFRVTAGDRCAC
ncbi:hypothetical protein R3P38DRAFT_2787579 [Favolaschia claudopus]|uniref:Uncharacterized protein n=1 Tax=Favolaschia claudopus TaxID=2862362 RepID=A0AAW0AMX2_9AGAR